MNTLFFGRIYKVRNETNNFPISRNRNAKNIETGFLKLNRPYLIIFARTYVYYLAVKTITKGNKENTYNDKTNVIIKNRNIYNENTNKLGNSINCSVINIMDKQMFLDLYDSNSNLNDVKVNDKIYGKVMLKMNKNLISNNIW
ncbi:Uncharacterised protein, partial [Metamycoplasma alkalescens]